MRLTGFSFVIAFAVGIVEAVSTTLPAPDPNIVHFLDGGNEKVKLFPDTEENTLQIFCRKGDPKHLLNYFRSAKLRVQSSAEDIKIISGYNENDVYYKFLSSTKWYLWAANLLPWRIREASFPTFNSSCVGISTSKSYKANLIIRPIDPWNAALLAAGIALFYYAPSLTKSTIFFYSSGTAIGALASALVLIFIIYRTLPKGKISYLSISVIWSVCLYFAGESWNRFEELVQEKLPYILVYLTTGAAVALITCYRVGPPSHPKTLNILQWCLQLFGVWLIHLSSEFVELSTSIIAVLAITYYFGRRAKMFVLGIWRRFFPQKIKLLTEEEYEIQKRETTRKSLIQLREFCSSPDCNSWKIVSRLKDPKRFASFLEGSDHIADEEARTYETDNSIDLDDSSADEEEDVLAAASFRASTLRSPATSANPPRSSTGRSSRQSTPNIPSTRSNGAGPSRASTGPRRSTRRNVQASNDLETDDDEESPPTMNGNAMLQTDDEDSF